MKTNEKILALRGKVNISKELSKQKSYSFVLEDVEIKQIKLDPTEDGSWDMTYVMENKGAINIIYEQETIRGVKKNGSQSQKLRYEIMKKYNDEGTKEDFYKREMSNIIENYITVD